MGTSGLDYGESRETLTTDEMRVRVIADLPARIVVGSNGAYWRDYGDHYSMCPVSDDNDPVEIVAIYNRNEADATAWDRGFAAGLRSASDPTSDSEHAL
jgi:hypothetical protein